MKVLNLFCGLLALEKKGKKDELVDRILEFLMEPQDSGKKVPKSGRKSGGGEGKRKSLSRRSKTKGTSKRVSSESVEEDDDSEENEANDEEEDADESMESEEEASF